MNYSISTCNGNISCFVTSYDTNWNHWQLRNDIHADRLCCNNGIIMNTCWWSYCEVSLKFRYCVHCTFLLKNRHFPFLRLSLINILLCFFISFDKKQRCSSGSKITLWWVERMDVDCVIFGPVFTLKSIPAQGNISRFSDIIQGGLVGLVEISACHSSNLLALDCTEN